MRHDCPLTPRSIGGRPSSQRLTRPVPPTQVGVASCVSAPTGPAHYRGRSLSPGTKLATLGDVRALIEKHLALTGSPRAAWILDNWTQTWPKFLRVFPHELKRVLAVEREKKASVGELQLPGALVAMAAGAEQVRHG